jgi:chromate transporter
MNTSIPVLASVNWRALALSVAAMIAIFRFKIGMIPVLAASCVVGVVWYLGSGVT